MELASNPLEEVLYRGFYPRVFSSNIPPHLFYPNYIETYLQRDVQDVINPSNVGAFHRFVQLCAGLAGQLINYSNLANTAGISLATAKEWLSILERSYTIFQLPPFYKNFNKRLVKTPRLYFYDTGLLCHLLGIKSHREVRTYYQWGALFENMIVAEIAKQAHHKGERPNLYFWRDSNGNEIDLVRESGGTLHLMEIKATRTLKPDHFRNTTKFRKWVGDQPARYYLAHGGTEDAYTRQEDTTVLNYKDVGRFLE